MRFCLVPLLTLLIAWPAQAADFDQPTRDYLEGIWLVGQAPDKGDCAAHAYPREQLEFEFRKSGGRVLASQPMDPPIPMAISGAATPDGILELSVHAPDGTALSYLRLRLQPPDRLEVLAPEGAKSRIAYRCGQPDRTVNDAVPPARLAPLSPDLSGGIFTEAVPGIPDDAICAGQQKIQPRRLQFELFGPVHYWLARAGFAHDIAPVFDYVRSIEVIDEARLKLHLQKRRKSGTAWDAPKNRGALYDLIIIDRGGRFEIPEWSASFIRCAQR